MLEIIVKHNDEKYLLPCSDIHKLTLPKMLDAKKIKYNKAIIYKTVASDLSDVDIKKYDLIVFFSPAGVKSLLNNFPKFEQNSTLIGAFGPTTAKAIKESGLKLNITAPTKTALSMTMAIEEYISKKNKK
ncbi:MAG: uroporphyrinogen-III synthase [Bacteroidales bacterium]|nr:uroporphyrinogen-III synthase [Bacteroidales bacterium]